MEARDAHLKKTMTAGTESSCKAQGNLCVSSRLQSLKIVGQVTADLNMSNLGKVPGGWLAELRAGTAADGRVVMSRCMHPAPGLRGMPMAQIACDTVQVEDRRQQKVAVRGERIIA